MQMTLSAFSGVGLPKAMFREHLIADMVGIDRTCLQTECLGPLLAAVSASNC